MLYLGLRFSRPGVFDGEPTRCWSWVILRPKAKQDAELTLMEFSDYQRPFCRRYGQSTWSHIDNGYLAAGKLRYVLRDFPITSSHAQAPKAADAAHRAGEQRQYWEMHG